MSGSQNPGRGRGGQTSGQKAKNTGRGAQNPTQSSQNGGQNAQSTAQNGQNSGQNTQTQGRGAQNTNQTAQNPGQSSQSRPQSVQNAGQSSNNADRVVQNPGQSVQNPRQGGAVQGSQGSVQSIQSAGQSARIPDRIAPNTGQTFKNPEVIVQNPDRSTSHVEIYQNPRLDLKKQSLEQVAVSQRQEAQHHGNLVHNSRSKGPNSGQDVHFSDDTFRTHINDDHLNQPSPYHLLTASSSRTSVASFASRASVASHVSSMFMSGESFKSKRHVTFPVLDPTSNMVRDILYDLVNDPGGNKRRLPSIDGRVVGDSGTDENDSGASLETECLLVKYRRMPRKVFIDIPLVDLTVVMMSVILLVMSNILLLRLIVVLLQRGYYLYGAYIASWVAVDVIVTGIYRFRRKCSKGLHGAGVTILGKLLRLITFTDPLFLGITWLREAVDKNTLKYHVKDKRKGDHNRHWLARRVIAANTYSVSQLKVSGLIAATTHSWQVIGLLTVIADPDPDHGLPRTSLNMCVVTCLMALCWAMVMNLPRRRTHLMVEDGSWIVTFHVLKYVWLFSFITSRVLAFYVFALAFHYSLFYVCLLHWFLLYLAMLFYSPPASRDVFISVFVYKPLLCSLYLLGFLNTQRGYLENSYGFFYMASLLFNLFLAYTALEAIGGSMQWVLMSIGMFVAGFVVMITDVVLRLRVRHHRIDVEIVVENFA